MYKKLKKILVKGDIKVNEPLSRHTSFRVGGKAKYYIQPASPMELIEVINCLNKYKSKYCILGMGTNVLALDEGYDGAIISTNNIKGIRDYNDFVQVFAGTPLSQLCTFYKDNNYKGLEDATMIPGSVGGAVVGNAGAYNFTMSNMVIGVLVVKDGKCDYLENKDCGFEYRDSRLRQCIVVSVDVKKEIGCDRNRIDYIIEQRINQPKGYSAGSVFKRCNGIIVSKMLDEMGYKGKRIGGAKVSEQHAGFIINDCGASSKDIVDLINIIKKDVKIKKGIDLEEEIKIIE